LNVPHLPSHANVSEKKYIVILKHKGIRKKKIVNSKLFTGKYNILKMVTIYN